MHPQDTFVARLRRLRERNHISLEEIAAVTRVNRELLEAFERNDLSNWPRGLYARAWVRAYASVVGLDPMDTVDEFCRLFPHGDRRTGPTLQEIAAIVAHPSEYRDEFSHDTDRRRSAPRINPPPPKAPARPRRSASAKAGVLPAPAWHTALARAAYAMWMRAVTRMTLASPRLKRTPRTSS
jgi:transcriptional regulator with XRE-family HTH domain